MSGWYGSDKGINHCCVVRGRKGVGGGGEGCIAINGWEKKNAKLKFVLGLKRRSGTLRVRHRAGLASGWDRRAGRGGLRWD